MANEMNDLISRKALLAEYDRVHIGPPGGARKLMEDAPSVNIADVPHWATEQAYKNGYEQGKKDAVEVDEVRSFANDVAYQFGYYCQNKGRLHITHGGLSTLEWAFDILEWENPHPVPECECEVDGCHEHATCGTPTKSGYKRVCGKHFGELQKEV